MGEGLSKVDKPSINVFVALVLVVLPSMVEGG